MTSTGTQASLPSSSETWNRLLLFIRVLTLILQVIMKESITHLAMDIHQRKAWESRLMPSPTLTIRLQVMLPTLQAEIQSSRPHSLHSWTLVLPTRLTLLHSCLLIIGHFIGEMLIIIKASFNQRLMWSKRLNQLETLQSLPWVLQEEFPLLQRWVLYLTKGLVAANILFSSLLCFVTVLMTSKKIIFTDD